MSGTPTRQVARAGVTGAAVGALGLLALQGLQQAIGAFTPPAEVSAAFVAAVVFATLAAERLRIRRDRAMVAEQKEEALSQAARCWEPQLLKEVDPDQLGTFGIFPMRRGGPAAFGEYVERSVDRRLCKALETAPLVLVIGGPRSGKSRTAFQAASTTLGDARALVPRDADGLRVLLELAPAPSSVRVVLWLDGLERFSGVVDAETLDRLRATHEPPHDGDSLYSGPPVTVVATIREHTWEELLTADGQPGEFAKAVATRARAFKVPTELDPEEEAAARRLHPKTGLGGGIGPALAASGKDEEAPVLRPIERKGDSSSGGDGPGLRNRLLVVWRDKLLLAPTLGFLVAVLAIPIGFILERPKLTLGEQQAEIRESGAKGARTSERPHLVDFHGSREESRVFSFRDEDRAQTDTSRADEIRVYDVEGDELEPRFRFEPDDPAVYQFRGIDDVDGDGTEELLGGYGPTVPLGELLVPFVLDWDEDTGEYQMVSLHRSEPSLEAPENGADFRAERPSYFQSAHYSDTSEEAALQGYPVQDFVVPEGSPYLVSGHYVSDPASERPASIELQVEIFDTQASSPQLRACEFPGDEPLLARDDPGLLLWQVLEKKWMKVKDKHCVTQF